MGKNIDRMIRERALDADAATRLNADVIAKVEAFSDDEIHTIIRFHLEVSSEARWEPDQDGSIF